MFSQLLKSIFGTFSFRTPPEVPEGTRVYAVGDIHGRLDLLEDVHGKMVADASRDNVQNIQIFVGDYIDRGSASKGVIDWLLTPPSSGWERICLKGNHEAIALEFLEDVQVFQMWERLGGLDTLRSYGVDLTRSHEVEFWQTLQDEFIEKMPEEHIEFYTNLPFYTVAAAFAVILHLVEIISLHSIDAFLYKPINSVFLIGWLWLACGVISALAATQQSVKYEL